MEQNGGSRNRPTHVWSVDFDKGAKSFEWRKDMFLSAKSPGKLLSI